MIHFHQVRYKNLLSTGNNFITIDLESVPRTLIVGSNGAGKSTILDALSFALYGKSFRGANKPLLVNSVNDKDCVVEVEFTVGSHRYKVVRGIKPNVFEIYKDGTLYNQTSTSKDYQNYLESNILNLSYRSFTQVVVLGTSNFKPFMQLTAAERRDVIEDLLDIGIFSQMNQIVKGRISTEKQELKDLEVKLGVAQEKIQLQEENIAELRKKDEKILQEKQSKIESYQQEIDTLLEDIKVKQQEISKVQQKIKEGDDAEEKIEKIEALRIKVQNKIDSLMKTIEFFDENDICPSCKQDIDETTKVKNKQATEESLQEAYRGEKKVEAQYKILLKKIREIQKHEQEAAQIQSEITQKNTMISVCQKHITDIQSDIQSLQTDDQDDAAEIKKLKKFKDEYKKLKNATDGSSEEMHYLKVAEELLKDRGIKSKIIQQYLPIINRLINQYLQALDFFINFHLDENFSETVRSRHRDDFSYESFSEGQKFRINIAILLAWRDIAKIKNSISTNLLILDEVFDSSLDTEGIDDFMKLLHVVSNDKTNVFVISHRGQNMIDKFDACLEFEMKKGFTVMEQS